MRKKSKNDQLLDDDIQVSHEQSGKDKVKGLIKKSKSPLKQLAKKKRSKGLSPHMVSFAATILLLIIVLFIYSLSYLVAPTYTLEAKIFVVRGGYRLEYSVCQPVSTVDENVQVGDTVYVTPYGVITSMSRNTLAMEVVEIDEQRRATLAFKAKGFPDFISTSEFKNMVKSNTDANHISKIRIVGKVVADRFNIIKIII
jgi:hypothetical protein